jgi:hypothetical protein
LQERKEERKRKRGIEEYFGREKERSILVKRKKEK